MKNFVSAGSDGLASCTEQIPHIEFFNPEYAENNFNV